MEAVCLPKKIISTCTSIEHYNPEDTDTQVQVSTAMISFHIVYKYKNYGGGRKGVQYLTNQSHGMRLDNAFGGTHNSY
jgi:hypothetical protein